MQSIQNGTTEAILQPISIDQPKNNPMSEIQQISSPQKITQEQTPSSIKHDAVQNLQQQEHSSISIFDKNTMGDNLNKALGTAANDIKSIENQESQSSHIGNDQHTKDLKKVLETPSHQPTENAPQISLETPKTEGTTITKEISSGNHPHLDEETNEAVQTYFNPEQKEVKTQDVENLISYLKDENIIDQQGKINFEKLGLDKKTIKKAGIKGEIFIKDGAFDFKISGKCSLEAQECLKALKGKLETLKEAYTLDIPININPASVGPLSAEDQAALANGGQIQYRTLPNGEVMKLSLDPGSNGEGDGLTIGVYKTGADHSLEQQSLSKKIPLNVVFQGAELNGKKVGPFLPNWREQKLFENSVIHAETNLRGTKTRRTNEGDVGRIQNQNQLWNAVNEYLKASVETTEGHFDINNVKQEKATSECTVENLEQQANMVDINNLNNNEDEIHELSNSTPANITSTSADLENTTSTKESTEEKIDIKGSTQQQAETSYSLGTNNAVDLNSKASLHQSNGINYQHEENIQELNKVGINANYSVTIENNIDEHFRQLDEEFTKIKNIPKDEYNEFETKYKNYKSAVKAYAKRPNKSKSFSERLNALSTSMKIKETNDLLSAAKEFAKMMQTVTEDLKRISNFEDAKTTTIDFEKLNNSTGVSKQTIGHTIFVELDKVGISTANKKDTDMVDELINFHKEHQEYTTDDTLLKAFIEHKKSEAKK